MMRRVLFYYFYSEQRMMEALQRIIKEEGLGDVA
jgi:hypothetical protein